MARRAHTDNLTVRITVDGDVTGIDDGDAAASERSSAIPTAGCCIDAEYVNAASNTDVAGVDDGDVASKRLWKVATIICINAIREIRKMNTAQSYSARARGDGDAAGVVDRDGAQIRLRVDAPVEYAVRCR